MLSRAPHANTQAALLWVSTLPGVTVDPEHVAAVGISDGGAPAVATGTRYKQFTHAITLHGRCAVSLRPGYGLRLGVRLKLGFRLRALCSVRVRAVF